MNVLVLAGTARSGSHTRRLGQAVADLVPGGRLAPPLVDLPYFDEDLEAAVPPAVARLRALVEAADLLVVVTPEYNGTVPGLLGNAVDWLSRPYAAGALRGKPALAVAASPGGLGGARALVSLRTLLGNAGADLLPQSLALPAVHERVLEDGSIDLALAAELRALLAQAEPALVAA